MKAVFVVQPGGPENLQFADLPTPLRARVTLG
jgi:hypothetical protein